MTYSLDQIDEIVKQAVSLNEQGMSLRNIAKTIGSDIKTIKKYTWHMNITWKVRKKKANRVNKKGGSAPGMLMSRVDSLKIAILEWELKKEGVPVHAQIPFNIKIALLKSELIPLEKKLAAYYAAS